MKKKLNIDFKGTADTIQNQVQEQGYELSLLDAIRFQEIKDGAERLYFLNLITEKEYEKVLKRLNKIVEKAIIKK